MQEVKTNTRAEYGTVKVKDPGAVIQLAVVIDNWKVPRASEIWAEAEKKAVRELAHIPFDPKDLFYSEQIPYPGSGNITIINRFYTPVENRVRPEKRAICRHGLGGDLCEECFPSPSKN